MIFEEALKQLKKGKSIRRKIWKDEGSYYRLRYFYNNKTTIEAIQNRMPHVALNQDDKAWFSANDVLANDWVVID